MDDDISFEDSDFVTEADVPLLNRSILEDVCRFSRRVSDVLVAVAAFGAAAWAWITWKAIDSLTSIDGDDFSFSPSGGDPTIGDYLTSLSQTASLLVLAAAVAGIGVGLRLVAAHVGSAVGVDVSDVAVGESLPDPEPADSEGSDG